MAFAAKALAWLFGGGGAETVAKTVDKLTYTDQEKTADDAQDLASTRAFAAPAQHYGFVNSVVDAANHAIRPWITVELLLRWFGYKEFPSIAGVDEFWTSATMLVLTFWFGGRMLLKDLPATIRAFRTSRVFR